MYSNIIWALCSDVNFCPLYSSVRCLSPWLNLSTPTPDSCRIKPMAAEHDVSISRSFVFRLLRAKEREERKKTALAKQQEGRAMATLDRQIPSPDTFLCEPWSSFVSAAKLRFVDSKFARR